MAEIEYIVVNGDTLSGISKKFYRSSKHYQFLAKYNKIENPDTILVGQKLKIPKYLMTDKTVKEEKPVVKVVLTSTAVPAEQEPVFPILIAESRNKPGYDRTNITQIADDMRYNDFTIEQYAQIDAMCRIDKWFGAVESGHDDHLFEAMKEMSTTFFAMGDLEDNIVKMIAHFKSNTGTDYRNPVLNREIHSHPSMLRFVEILRVELTKQLKNGNVDGDIMKVKLPTLPGRPQFSRFEDKFFGGLTIAINDTAAFKVEVLSYSVDIDNEYAAKLRVTLYDHFGLDRPDLEKIFVNLVGFRAWFILQHIRGYRPFITIVENEYFVSDRL